MLLTVILIALFLTIMILVSKIQGTARVVNYAGLVRGKTQQIIKSKDVLYIRFVIPLSLFPTKISEPS